MAGTAKRKELWVNGNRVAARSINVQFGGPEGTEELDDVSFQGLSYEFMSSTVEAEVIFNADTDRGLWDTSATYDVVVRLVDTGQSYGNPVMSQKLVLKINDAVANVAFCGNPLEELGAA